MALSISAVPAAGAQADVHVFPFGNAPDVGDTGSLDLAAPLVGVAATPSGNGYWLAAADGGVFAFGDARFRGSAAGLALAAPIVGVAAMPSGNGYWLAAADGGVFAFGDARFRGSAAGLALAAPIVGVAATPSGNGYWLAAADGGVFAYGDARFRGSAAGLALAAPIVGVAATPSGGGYWLAAADGGVFAYGDARFRGSAAGLALAAPVVDIDVTPTGDGYWLAGEDGGVFTYGDARFAGSGRDIGLRSGVVAMATTPTGDGYWLVTQGVITGPAIVVRSGDPRVRDVALTFDAGSDCGNAAAILDTLAANRITATFGLTGRWVELCPALAARIGRERHLIMNHSYNHPSFTGFSTGTAHLTEAQIVDQLRRGEEAIEAATASTPRPWFRPPYGDHDPAVNAAVARAGYHFTVLWTVDSLGWKGIAPDQIVANILAKLGNGAIVLMHVGAAADDHLALQAVIDAARARGLSFVTVAGLV